METVLQVLGWIIFLMPTVTLFYFMAKDGGLKSALLAYLMIALLLGSWVLGYALITGQIGLTNV